MQLQHSSLWPNFLLHWLQPHRLLQPGFNMPLLPGLCFFQPMVDFLLHLLKTFSVPQSLNPSRLIPRENTRRTPLSLSILIIFLITVLVHRVQSLMNRNSCLPQPIASIVGSAWTLCGITASRAIFNRWQPHTFVPAESKELTPPMRIKTIIIFFIMPLLLLVVLSRPKSTLKYIPKIVPRIIKINEKAFNN